MRIKFFVIILLIIVPAVSAYAQKSVFSREYPRMMTSVRAMGMGNAFFGVSDDKYAGFYNPAGLAMNKNSWTLDIIPLSIGANSNLIDNAVQIQDIFDSMDTAYITKLLNNMLGQYNDVAPIGFFPAFTMNNWSVGIFVNSGAHVLSYNRVMPKLAVKAQADAGVIGTYAHSFLKDKSLHLGVSLIGFYRAGYAASYSATELPNVDMSSELDNIVNNSGWGVIATVGIMYELPWLRDVLNPRVGLSFNDFGYTSFGSSSSIEEVNPTLNLTLAISPKWEFITSNIVIDFNDLIFMNGSDKDFGKRVNIGAEVGFWNRIFIRAGLHQGYWTAGAGVDLWAVRLNYAYYTEELGAYAGQFKDSRHVIECVIGWNQQKKKN